MPLTKDKLSAALDDLNTVNYKISEDNIQYVVDCFNAYQAQQKIAYDSSWTVLLDAVNEEISRNTDLNSVVNNLNRPVSTPSIIPSFISEPCNYNLGNFQETPGHNLIAHNGQYHLVDENHVDMQLPQCLNHFLTPDVDTVVEFGAGWGKNLGLLSAVSGRTDFTYMACEPSDSGRQAFENIFKLNSSLRYVSHPFDFYEPSVDMLKGSRNVLAYTCAAIEQIAFFPSSFIEDLLNCAEKVTLIFFEPIGWQRMNEELGYALDTMISESCFKNATEDKIIDEYVFEFTNEKFLHNAATWAAFGNYNMNLLHAIGNVVESGQAKIADLRYDLYGSNPVNPYTLVVLQKT